MTGRFPEGTRWRSALFIREGDLVAIDDDSGTRWETVLGKTSLTGRAVRPFGLSRNQMAVVLRFETVTLVVHHSLHHLPTVRRPA